MVAILSSCNKLRAGKLYVRVRTSGDDDNRWFNLLSTKMRPACSSLSLFHVEQSLVDHKIAGLAIEQSSRLDPLEAQHLTMTWSRAECCEQPMRSKKLSHYGRERRVDADSSNSHELNRSSSSARDRLDALVFHVDA